MYSTETIGNRMVNPVKNTKDDVEKILSSVLENTGLKYKKINGTTFVILNEGQKFKKNQDLKAVTPEMNIEAFRQPVFLTITGRILGPDNQPLPGVSVQVKGTSRGTSTNANGAYSIEANKGETLVFSYVGYQTQEVVVGDDAVINISLTTSGGNLGEVVVTALGIQRQAKSLTYSVQKVNNEQLTTVKDANFINNLTGRVAGVTITKSSSGIGGSTRVVLRGNKSTRENQPLYVIDGIPMSNFNPAQPADEWGQSGVGFVGLDAGDGISNINPDDIENVTVLKGASAAALYGSQAANGVILITTKKGHAGKTRVDFSTEEIWDKPLYYQPLQFKYGQTEPATANSAGSLQSWGGVVNAPDHVKPFFQTGLTSFNTVSLNGGTDKSQTYFSYSHTGNKGLEPTSSLKKENLNFRQTSRFFNDRLTADFNVLYTHQQVHNRPVSGLYDNPLTGLYELPRGLNFDQYKNFETFSTLRNTNVQNWWDNNYDKNWAGTEVEQNPYWILNRVPSDNKLDRVYTNLALTFKVNSWINLQARGNIDKSINDIDLKSYATTSIVLTANNGAYAMLRAINTQLYGDLLLSGSRELSPSIGLNATIGTSINDNKLDQSNFGTKNSGDGLRYANKFGLAFILPEALTVSQTFNHKQVQSVFATAQLHLKDYLYLDLTGRNDWSSTFAYTPVEKKGYFYYSAGVNAILTDVLHMAEPISFSKVRVSYAKVGNDVPVYVTNQPPFTVDNQNGTVVNTKGPYPGTYLKPEDNRSFEAGTEWRFIHDRVGFDFTYYVNNNFNQYIETGAPSGGVFSTYFLNAGNIRNNGVELSVYGTPVKSKTFTWNSTINYAFNKNKIVQVGNEQLGANTKTFQLTGIGNLLYASYIVEGGSWGDIYGRFFQRAADGSIVVDADGKPVKGTDPNSPVGDQNLKLLGNPTPRYTLGWDNKFNIKDFTVGFLIDGRFGGKVMSVTQAVLDGLGDSKATADARDAGGVNINATKTTGDKWTGPIDAKTFYTGVGGASGISEYYMYDATNVRLREASIGYLVPVHAHWVRNLQVSLIGRNLFFFSKKAPFDPEVSMATNNGLQGVDTFGLPTTRSVGFSVKVGF